LLQDRSGFRDRGFHSLDVIEFLFLLGGLALLVGCQGVSTGSSGSSGPQLSATPGALGLGMATSNSTTFTIGELSLPTTIAAGQSVPFTVTFSPHVAGSASATLSFTSNPVPSATVEAPSGTGTEASTHSVNPPWTGSSS
jgi:hypothetical protein